MTKIINLFAGPGAGKSTTAAGLFYKMKKKFLNVELVQEYAKEKVWENSTEILSDQLYITAKQHRRLQRLIGKVDYVVTDSPILLAAYYGEKYGNLAEITVPLVHQLFESYNNLNVFLCRTKPYFKAGRLGDESGAKKADDAIKNLLSKYPHIEICDSDSVLEDILGALGILEGL